MVAELPKPDSPPNEDNPRLLPILCCKDERREASSESTSNLFDILNLSRILVTHCSSIPSVVPERILIYSLKMKLGIQFNHDAALFFMCIQRSKFQNELKSASLFLIHQNSSSTLLGCFNFDPLNESLRFLAGEFYRVLGRNSRNNGHHLFLRHDKTSIVRNVA